jgi:hypothetical protein
MALLAALIFSWTSIFFTTAGQRLGVTTVNLLRLPGAALCLGTMHLVLYGTIWPAGLALPDQIWIGLSGIVVWPSATRPCSRPLPWWGPGAA